MTEDQEFALLEAKLKAKQDYLMADSHFNASLAAQQFVEDYKNELSIITLRKAFERGFIAGHTDAKNTERRRAAKLATEFPFSPQIGYAIAELIRKED